MNRALRITLVTLMVILVILICNGCPPKPGTRLAKPTRTQYAGWPWWTSGKVGTGAGQS